jgi:hypothetical protein
MIKGLFINNKKAKDSIYESGYMVYQSLSDSSLYSLHYHEIDINDRKIAKGYDFYFFNYHPVTMYWLNTRELKKELGFVITMILEVAPGDAFVLCPEKDFDLYCALDPTLKQKQNLYPFPRPLEKADFTLPPVNNTIPVIGSFGFATKGKGFQHVVEAVNKEFEKAVIKINIPYGDFVPESEQYAKFIGELCKQKAKQGIEVQVTHDFMSKEALIKWCGANTLNCFLYDRNMPGLSATTDQAITSGKPLSVSDNDTFRHITAYLPPYPQYSLKASIEKSVPIVEQMKRDWQPDKFRERFEQVIEPYQSKMIKKGTADLYFELSIKKPGLTDPIKRRIKKYKRKLRDIKITQLFTLKRKNEII